jgi:hypothetical protein
MPSCFNGLVNCVTLNFNLLPHNIHSSVNHVILHIEAPTVEVYFNFTDNFFICITNRDENQIISNGQCPLSTTNLKEA